MIFKREWGHWRKTGLVLICVIALTVGAAYGSDSPSKSGKPSSTLREAKVDLSDWKRIVEAAKKEGKLVIAGDPSEVWRKSAVDLFREEFPEITVEYTGILPRNLLPRIRQERALGQKLWDLELGGASSAYDFRKEGFLDPIRPLLQPENSDDSKWIGGLNGLFSDKEQKYLAAYTLYIQQTTAINRDFIKESDIKSSSQLLDPKFKGKFILQTPTAAATFFALCNMAVMYGENFIRDLLSKQNMVITDDKRQQAEWVVRGKYPIAIGFNDTQLIPFVKEGLGKNIAMLEDKITPITLGAGGIMLFKDVPHPNASKVYINWLLAKKAQTKVCKNILLNSRRTDVPPVVKELAVDPAHLNNYYDYTTEENTETGNRFLPVIKAALQK